MTDSITHTITYTEENPAPLDLDQVDRRNALLVQALVDDGVARSSITVQTSGHDDLAGPVRTGDDYEPTEGEGGE